MGETTARETCGGCRWFASASGEAQFGACTRNVVDCGGRAAYERRARLWPSCSVFLPAEEGDGLERLTMRQLRAVAKEEGCCLGYDGARKSSAVAAIREHRHHMAAERAGR